MVLTGFRYSSAIDMWSLGCIVVELFLGLPLFPGSSEYNQVSRITEMLGLPPMWMLEMGKQSGEFFEKTHDEYGRRTYRLKSMEQYSREHNTKEQPSKKYFQATTLPDIIRTYAMPRKNMKPAEIDRGGYMSPNLYYRTLTCSRGQQSYRFYRFCTWLAQHQPPRTVVSAAGEATPFHHPAKVYTTFCTAYEPQIIFCQQDARSRCSTTATSRSYEQATCCAGGPSSSAGAISCSVSLRDANESVSADSTCTATSSSI